MAKYKIKLADNYKEWMTISDVEHIAEIKKNYDIQSDAECMVKTYAWNLEILKYDFEWCKNINGFYENGIDILITLVVWDGYTEVRKMEATFADINSICTYEDWENCGYQTVFKKV